MNVGFSAAMPPPAATPVIRRQSGTQPMMEPVFAGKSEKSSGSNLLLIGLAGAALAFLATTLLRNQRQEGIERLPAPQDTDVDRPLVVDDKDLDGFR